MDSALPFFSQVVLARFSLCFAFSSHSSVCKHGKSGGKSSDAPQRHANVPFLGILPTCRDGHSDQGPDGPGHEEGALGWKNQLTDKLGPFMWAWAGLQELCQKH